MRQTQIARRTCNRSRAHQEVRFMERHPLHEISAYYGVERPLADDHAMIIINAVAGLLEESQNEGRLPELGLDVVTDSKVAVFGPRRMPKNNKQAFRVGVALGELAGADVRRQKVAGQIGRVVATSHSRNLNLELYAPDLIEEKIGIYETLGLKSPKNLSKDQPFRIPIITGDPDENYHIRKPEVGAFDFALQNILKDQLPGGVVNLGSSVVYPHLQDYLR